MELCWAASTEKGKKRENQDTFLAIDLSSPSNNSSFSSGPLKLDKSSFLLFGVFDGHGDAGKAAAQTAKELITSKISSINLGQLKRDPKKELETIFEEVDVLLRADEKVDTYLSGTTASLLLILDQQFISAHLGDGRILIVTRSRSTPENPEILFSTKEHSCELKGEKERISATGARIDRLLYGNEAVGPLRIFKGTLPYPGLAVTRTFGDDVAKRLGVICKPDVEIHRIDDKTDYFLVIACDGVWDALSNEKVIDLALSSNDENEATRKITQESLKSLDELEIDDNTTNVCLFVNRTIL